MKRFNAPFISRGKHLEMLNELDKQVDELNRELRLAEQELKEFRSAQRGDCIQSQRCKGCKHCLSYSERTLYYSTYTNVVCEFTVPQCQKYQQKDDLIDK